MKNELDLKKLAGQYADLSLKTDSGPIWPTNAEFSFDENNEWAMGRVSTDVVIPSFCSDWIRSD